VVFVTVNSGEVIQPSHINQFANLLLGTPSYGQAVSFSQVATANTYALTVQHQLTGATGNKMLLVKDASGTTQLEVASLGGGGTYETNVATWARHLICSNVRNWNTLNDVTFAYTRLGAEQGAHVTFVSSYQVASTPNGGDIPDDSAGSFVTFVQNIASGATQNANGGYRAGEFELIIYENTAVARDASAIQAGTHTALAKINNIDSTFGGLGTADVPYGNGTYLALSLDQGSLSNNTWGTKKIANYAFLAGGNPGHRWLLAGYDTSDTPVYGIEGQTGKVWSGTVVPRTSSIFSLGDSTHLWNQVWSNTGIFNGNGSVANPSWAVIGSGNYADGMFGSGSGGVLGVGIAGVEKVRWDASGVQWGAGERIANNAIATIAPSQITSNQNNYSPTGLATARVLRLTSDAARDITGIVAQNAGTLLKLINLGAFTITLKHASGSSTAANRINGPSSADIALVSLSSVELIYDAGSTAWMKAA
jgi:hypothetical protein